MMKFLDNLLEKYNINEDIEDLEGHVELVGNANNYYVWKILTYEGAQQFTRNGRDAASGYFQNENTFNSNIPSRYSAYFITIGEESNEAINGIIIDAHPENVQPSISVEVSGNPNVSTVTSNAQIENVNGHSKISYAELEALRLIPGFHYVAFIQEPEQVAEVPAGAPEEVQNSQPEPQEVQNDEPESQEVQDNETEPQADEQEVQAEVEEEPKQERPLLRYKVIDKDKISILGWYPKDDYDVLTIPEEIDGKKVVEIGPLAFYNEDNVQKIYLPRTIERIRKGAFCGFEGRLYVPNRFKAVWYALSKPNKGLYYF